MKTYCTPTWEFLPLSAAETILASGERVFNDSEIDAEDLFDGRLKRHNEKKLYAQERTAFSHLSDGREQVACGSAAKRLLPEKFSMCRAVKP